MKPDFIIGGIAKNGTTYLSNLIRRHPKIDMPKRSMDQSFFDNDLIYQNGLLWYESLFEDCDESKLIGQISADCAFNKHSIERIKKDLPNVKLIFIFRDPVDSVYSLYWHQVKMAREKLSFERGLKLEEKRIKKDYYNYKMYSYIGRYRFSVMEEEIYKYFDENQVLFLPFEVFIKDELRILNKVFEFLEIDSIKNIEELKIKDTPKNKAKIPVNLFMVKIAYRLRKLGFEGVAMNLLNRFLREKKPPEMKKETRKNIENMMYKDIDFHQKLVKKYQ